MSNAPKKTPGGDSMRDAVKSLKRTVADTIAAKEPKGDARGMRRQTLYLPPAVHEQLRHLAFNRKESQQELFRQGLNLLFAREGLPSWEELEEKAQ
jgi:hypothetical protein